METPEMQEVDRSAGIVRPHYFCLYMAMVVAAAFAVFCH